MLTRTEVTYVWDRDRTWADEHIDEIEKLCLKEASETKMKKFWIERRPFINSKNEERVKMITNSRYVFRYMLKTEMNEMVDKRIEEKMKEMTNK